MSLQKIDQNATYESLRLAHNETVETVTTIQTEIEEVKNSSVTPDNLPIAGESLGVVKSGGDVTIEADGTMTVNDNSHNHTVENISNFPSSLPASDVHEWAKAESKPTYTASEVGADAVGSANTALESAKAYTDELANGAVATNTAAIEAINNAETGILAQAKAYVDTQDAANKEYVDGKIDSVIGEGASETLDTIGEISKAIEDNKDILETLNSAVGNKANSSDLTDHTGNTSNPHNVTAEQIGLGNVENKSSSEILSELTKENVTTALGYTPIETETTYSVATESNLGLVKSGGDVTVAEDGTMTVNIDAGSADTALNSAKAYTDELANGAVKTNTEAIATINDTENGILAQSKAYTDEKIDAIVGEGASETLDTIGEISKAIEDNQDIMNTLNSAIGNKANSSELTAHTGNTSNPHGVTAEQIGLGNVENKSSETIRGELTKENITTALGYTPSESDTTYSAATSSELGLVQIGSNITNESGVLSITKENVTAALGYTPPETAGSAVISSSIILSADGWDGTTSNQVISVEGVTLSNIVIVSPIPSDQDAYSSSSIKCIDQGEGSLTFNCGTIPTTDITVNVVIL